MQDLIRGTTPSLIVDFSDTELSVTDITQAVLASGGHQVKIERQVSA
jgi:hypothetical protein